MVQRVQSQSMKTAPAATTPNLLQERDALHEEVRQLRAALQIYTEVVRRLQVSQLEVNRPQRAA